MGGCCCKRKYKEERRCEAAEINRLLPAEMLERVFRLLPSQELMTVVQVCRRWREVAEAPILWAWLRLPTVNQDNLAAISELLQHSKRLQALEALVVRSVSEDLLAAVAQHKSLKRLDIANTSLSSVEPTVLAKAICQMEEVDMGRSLFSPAQANVIFQSLAEGSNVNNLSLFNTNLSTVKPQLLARAVTEVNQITLWSSRLTTKQTEAIFGALTSNPGKLRILDLSYNDLSTVSPKVLAVTVNSLESVDLGRTCLTGEQVNAILSQALVATSLTSLWISGVRGEVEREGVVKAAKIIPELRVLCRAGNLF